MPVGAGHDAFQSRMAKRGFDPANIMKWITAIIAMFSGCTVPTPAAVRKVSLPRVANAIREEDPTIGFLEARRQAKEVLAERDAAKDEELQSMIDDCRE